MQFLFQRGREEEEEAKKLLKT
jgi:hypothetical protein